MLYRAIKHGSEHALHSVRWLIHGRLLVVLFIICVQLLWASIEPERGIGPPAVYGLLLCLAVLNIAYLLLLPRLTGRLFAFATLQFTVDIAAETGLVFFTGGTSSSYVNLYFVTIVAASLLTSRRRSALFASLAAIGLALVVLCHLMGWGATYIDEPFRTFIATDLDLWNVIRRLLLLTLAFFVVAYLSGLLSDRLELARSINEEILQNMSEGVALFDLDGRLVFFNREFETLFSPRRALQLGDSAANIFPGTENAPIRALLVQRTTARMEILPFNKPEEQRPPLEIRVSPLGEPETPKGMVMLAIDLSLQHRADLAERQAARFAAMSEMAAALAHEIRNPLASVRGSLQEISRDFPAEHSNRRLAEIVIREADRLDRIISAFLNFARQRPLRPAMVDLHSLLEEVQTLLRQRPDAAEVRIDIAAGAVPAVRGDPDLLRELFLNLGVNALEAMAGKGALTFHCPAANAAPVDVKTTLRMSLEQGVTITVADTGPGLPGEAEKRVFEPFFTTKPKGSGLGLAIAKRIVEAHAGAIWFHSQPGAGTRFFVWLPCSGPFLPNAPIAVT